MIGASSLVRCLEMRTSGKDIFLVYELCGASLSSQVYEMKGEFYKGERIYRISFGWLHGRLFKTQCNNLLRSLTRKLLNVVDLVSSQGMVHCDLKPENILVDVDKADYEFKKVSLIDFGSCFGLADQGAVGMATPEYLPPEMIQIFMGRNSSPSNSQIEHLNRSTHPWSIDIWSVGAVLFEILTGIPHWLAYKCRIVDIFGKSIIKQGIFSAKLQDFNKIHQKQVTFCENFHIHSKDIEQLFDCQMTAKLFTDLLGKMMNFDPMRRISPQKALQHPFLTQSNTIIDFTPNNTNSF